jgi:hypothetical protein
MNLGMLYLRAGRIQDACGMMDFASDVAPASKAGMISRFISMNCKRI